MVVNLKHPGGLSGCFQVSSSGESDAGREVLLSPICSMLAVLWRKRLGIWSQNSEEIKEAVLVFSFISK